MNQHMVYKQYILSPLQRYNYYSACVMTFGKFLIPILDMLLSHVVVHIPILSHFIFRQSLYYLFYLLFLSFLLPEIICFFKETFNIVALEVIVGYTCEINSYCPWHYH